LTASTSRRNDSASSTPALRPGAEGADVLGQTAAAEAQTGPQEAVPDARVVADGLGEVGDVGAGRLAQLGHGVDEGDLRGEERVRRGLHQLRGRQVGDEEGHAGLDERGVDLAQHRLVAGVVDADDEPVRAQRVVDREALAEELGVPREVDVGACRGQCRDPLAQGAGSSHRHGRLAHDEAGPVQQRREGVDGGSTWLRSAACEPDSWGVPTQTKCTSPKAAASAYDVVNRSRPEAVARSSTSGRPGSKNGARPAESEAIFASSTSTPSTSKPRSAMQAACTAPR
jgi:hypothetical protein